MYLWEKHKITLNKIQQIKLFTKYFLPIIFDKKKKY